MPVFAAARQAASLARFQVESEELAGFLPRAERLGEIIAVADVVVADLSNLDPNVLFQVGLATAMGKGLFLLAQHGTPVPSDLHGYDLLRYETTKEGLSQLTGELSRSLQRFRRFPRRRSPLTTSTAFPTFVADWDRLEPPEAENLCRELLAQMGYRAVDWAKGIREFDLIAELPRKDPDGYQYNELWLISMGRNAPPEMLLDLGTRDPAYLLHMLSRGDDRSQSRLFSRPQDDASITLLLILTESTSNRDRLVRLFTRYRDVGQRRASGIRLRVWDRDYLSALVQQFPQIGYKYFSDEARSRSKYRKTPDELYDENVALLERQVKLNTDLEEEKNRRVRAERDAIWKDISFAAAHKIGNPIFAIETNLEPLHRRVSDGRRAEALEIISRISISVEKSKVIVDQFKSLTRAQEINPVSITLNPIIIDACRTARDKGITCEVELPEDLRVHGDPQRLSECFDELIANALHWLDKAEKRISVRGSQSAPNPLPPDLDTSRPYALIHVADNGTGVPADIKAKIFDAFFTTHEHGTGLGLALVRRIIEGHSGEILEVGVPGQGADFEIFLPSAPPPDRAPVSNGAGRSRSPSPTTKNRKPTARPKKRTRRKTKP